MLNLWFDICELLLPEFVHDKFMNIGANTIERVEDILTTRNNNVAYIRKRCEFIKERNSLQLPPKESNA